jgi:O-antigen ligase
MVVTARSATSLVVVGAIVGLIPIFRSLRLRSTPAAAVLTVFILLAAVLITLVIANLEPVFAALGRDATLTGRTDIWAAVLLSIAERPFLGYGYSAFWAGWNGPALAVVGSVGWETPHSHNGLLDLWLDLGAVGLLTFLVGLGLAAKAGVRIARHTSTAAGLWPLSYLTFLMIMNLAEASLLRQHSLFWILYVTVLSSASPWAGGSDLEPAQSERRRFRSSSLGAAAGPVSPGVRRTVRFRGGSD